MTLATNPAIVLPCGVDDHGMPFGPQAVGRFGGDIELLGAAGMRRIVSPVGGLTLGRMIALIVTTGEKLIDCITFNPLQCGGRPCIRGMRIRVSNILEMLAAGATEAQILADFPDLKRDHIGASLQFAARRSEIARFAA